jgi:hypothetical protein
MNYVVNATPLPLNPPGKRPGAHCIGGWEGPRAGLDGCGKSRPPPGFDPRTVQPVASRYTDSGIVAIIIIIINITLLRVLQRREYLCPTGHTIAYKTYLHVCIEIPFPATDRNQ